MPTSSDVIAVALRRLKVLAADENTVASDEAYCDGILTALFDELPVSEGIVFPWDLATIPQGALIPLGNLLATEVAQTYNMASEPRHRAMGRLRGYMIANDIPLRGDLDDDGVVDENEQWISDGAKYY